MGEYGEWKNETNEAVKCPKCGCGSIMWREWESSDGGHEDYQFRCTYCQHTWWVDGPDA